MLPEIVVLDQLQSHRHALLLDTSDVVEESPGQYSTRVFFIEHDHQLIHVGTVPEVLLVRLHRTHGSLQRASRLVVVDDQHRQHFMTDLLQLLFRHG
ncbi:hypothetical protein D3C81_1939250 [compost metagenome]